jgi:3-hydroxybutyryl-CoA dehydratase
VSASLDPVSASLSPSHSRARTLDWSAWFDRLSPGDRFRSAERAVEEADVQAFCALTGDWHPVHSDPAWAASSQFGERIAHGLLVLGLAVGLLPLDPERVIVLRRVSDAVFKRPVRFGERVRVEGDVSACKPVDDATGLVELRWSIRNQDSALVCAASVQLLWRRAPA